MSEDLTGDPAGAAFGDDDLVRRTLEEARRAAKSQGKEVGRGRRSFVTRVPRKGSRRTWSAAGPDVRDPQPISAVTSDLARDLGWSHRVAEGTVFARWAAGVREPVRRDGADAVGDGIVTALRIVGPTAPSWRKGRLHVSGRGPRDTYG